MLNLQHIVFFKFLAPILVLDSDASSFIFKPSRSRSFLQEAIFDTTLIGPWVTISPVWVTLVWAPGFVFNFITFLETKLVVIGQTCWSTVVRRIDHIVTSDLCQSNPVRRDRLVTVSLIVFPVGRKLSGRLSNYFLRLRVAVQLFLSLGSKF